VLQHNIKPKYQILAQEMTPDNTPSTPTHNTSLQLNLAKHGKSHSDCNGYATMPNICLGIHQKWNTNKSPNAYCGFPTSNVLHA